MWLPTVTVKPRVDAVGRDSGRTARPRQSGGLTQGDGVRTDERVALHPGDKGKFLFVIQVSKTSAKVTGNPESWDVLEHYS